MAVGNARSRKTRRTTGTAATGGSLDQSSLTAHRSRGQVPPPTSSHALTVSTPSSRQRRRDQGEDAVPDDDSSDGADQHRWSRGRRHHRITGPATADLPPNVGALSAGLTNAAPTVTSSSSTAAASPAVTASVVPSVAPASAAVPTISTATVAIAIPARTAAPAATLTALTAGCACSPPATADYVKGAKPNHAPAGHEWCNSRSRIKPLDESGNASGKKRGKPNAQGVPQHKTCRGCRKRILQTKLRH